MSLPPAEGGRDYLIHIREARCPAGIGAQRLSARNEHGCVSHPARPHHRWHWTPCDPAHGFRYLLDGVAATGADIIPDAAIIELIEHPNMCVCEIGDVHVVPDAGAVRCGVIRPEDGERRTSAQDGIDREGYQVGFGVMILAQASFRIGARRIEIPQACAPETVDLICAVEDSTKRGTL